MLKQALRATLMAGVVAAAAAPDGGERMKTLDGLQVPKRLTTHLACLEGAARYLKVDVSTAWLYGGTGHAFVMCLGENLCPSGPHCWRQGPLHRLARNLPIRIGGVAGPKATPELLEKAWAHVRESVGKGHPCYGWHWEWIPIRGYDADGYLYPEGVDGPKDWRDFGAKAIGFLELYSVSPKEPAADRKTVRDALAFAVDWASSWDKWTLKGYDGGLAAYDTWIKGMTSGKTDSFGLAYHARIWSECRGFAVEFLREADTRTNGEHAGLFRDAVGHYTVVSGSLAQISRLWPWPDKDTHDANKEAVKARTLDGTIRDRIVSQLRRAKGAEAAGIAALRELIRALGDGRQAGSEEGHAAMRRLQTSRLVIRPFTPDDWAGFLELTKDYNASKGGKYEGKWGESEEQCREAVEHMSRQDKYFAVCLRATGELIGLLALNGMDADKQLDLGHVIHTRYQDGDHDKEALGAMVAHVFREKGALSIVARWRPEWAEQFRTLQALGGKFTDDKRGEMVLTKEDWNQAHGE